MKLQILLFFKFTNVMHYLASTYGIFEVYVTNGVLK